MDTRDIVDQLQDACDLETEKRELERICGNAKTEIQRLRETLAMLFQETEWIVSADKLHPDKPGLHRYEQIPCLIVKNRDILLRQWNCEHLVWDTEDGDDFYCNAEDVTHWMPLPALPSNVKVSSLPQRADGSDTNAA